MEALIIAALVAFLANGHGTAYFIKLLGAAVLIVLVVDVLFKRE
jgi:hypothetical protein